MFSDREQGVGHFDHVLTALRGRKSQQCSDLRSVYTALILKGLWLRHMSRIGDKLNTRGAGRARTDGDQMMSLPHAR